MSLARIADLLLVDLPRHVAPDGQLVVVETGKAIAFGVTRMFTVTAAEGAVRGRHAHKRCIQFLMCVRGRIDVECDDGESKVTLTLEEGHKGLLVPPSIWASETYMTPGAVLIVLCDRPYEPEDYLREYDVFLSWRATNG